MLSVHQEFWSFLKLIVVTLFLSPAILLLTQLAPHDHIIYHHPNCCLSCILLLFHLHHSISIVSRLISLRIYIIIRLSFPWWCSLPVLFFTTLFCFPFSYYSKRLIFIKDPTDSLRPHWWLHYLPYCCRHISIHLHTKVDVKPQGMQAEVNIRKTGMSIYLRANGIECVFFPTQKQVSLPCNWH